jgi:hypothetical protein
MLIDNLTQAFVDLLPLEEEFVEVRLSEDASESSKSNLGGGLDVVGYLQNGLNGIHHHKVDHGVHFDRDVIFRDHNLRFHDHGDHSKIHLDHAIHKGNDQVKTRLSCSDESAESENDASLILSNDFDGEAQKSDAEKSQDDDKTLIESFP